MGKAKCVCIRESDTKLVQTCKDLSKGEDNVTMITRELVGDQLLLVNTNFSF